MAATKEAKKKSIQSTPDRPDLVWAIKHLNVAGWIAVVGLCLSSVYIGINLAKVGQVREYFDVQVPPEIQIQKVEVPKFVKVYGGLTPDTEKRVNALFQEHEKRMSELKGELRILEQYGDKAWLYSATSISASANIFGPPPKPPTAAEIRAMIAAEQRSFAASLELLSASLAKPEY